MKACTVIATMIQHGGLTHQQIREKLVVVEVGADRAGRGMHEARTYESHGAAAALLQCSHRS